MEISVGVWRRRVFLSDAACEPPNCGLQLAETELWCIQPYTFESYQQSYQLHILHHAHFYQLWNSLEPDLWLWSAHSLASFESRPHCSLPPISTVKFSAKQRLRFACKRWRCINLSCIVLYRLRQKILTGDSSASCTNVHA